MLFIPARLDRAVQAEPTTRLSLSCDSHVKYPASYLRKEQDKFYQERKTGLDNHNRSSHLILKGYPYKKFTTESLQKK